MMNALIFSIFVSAIFVNVRILTSQETSSSTQSASTVSSTNLLTSLNPQPNLNVTSSVAQSTTGSNMTVPEQETKAILKYVFLLFRHGDRAPVALYPTDPYPPYIFEPGLQQLTNEGKRRAFKLGENLGVRYGNLSGGLYNVTKITFNSTSVNRCLQTAECVTTGWFPPQGPQIWNPQINWQPIPIFTQPEASDYVISMTGYCRNADTEQNRYFQQSSEVQEVCSKYADVIQKISAGSGIPLSPCNSPKTFDQIQLIYDTIFVQSTQYNLPVPDWAKPYFPHPMLELRGETAQIAFDDDLYASLRVGPLYDVILNDMQKIINGVTTPPVHAMSGHDMTIVALQRPLKIYNNISPPYTACMALELWQQDNDYTVEAVYSNSTEYPFYKLELPDCPSPCTFNQFSNVLNKFIVKNLMQACFEENIPLIPPFPPLPVPTWWLSLINYIANDVPGLVFNNISPIGFNYY